MKSDRYLCSYCWYCWSQQKKVDTYRCTRRVVATWIQSCMACHFSPML